MTKATQRRYAALDGLRGIAALVVFAIHVWIYQLPNTVELRRDSWEKTLLFEGRVAFVMFFVLSGYLLYRAFARAALGGGGPAAVGSYLVRRAGRIAPAYYLALARHARPAGRWRATSRGAAWWTPASCRCSSCSPRTTRRTRC